MEISSLGNTSSLSHCGMRHIFKGTDTLLRQFYSFRLWQLEVIHIEDVCGFFF